MNLYCSFDSTPPPNYFYQVEVLPDNVPSDSSFSLSVGVVRPSEVKKGWGTKGMFYNGNLTNGSAALKIGYGPRLKPGDAVVVEYQYAKADMKHRVKFHMNGTCLGRAFEIVQDPRVTPELFVPCLHCHGQIEVRTQVQLTREGLYGSLAYKARKPELWEGDWDAVQAWKAPEPINQQDTLTPIWPFETSQPGISQQQVLTLHLEPLSSDNTSTPCAAVVVEVCNSIRVNKRIVPSPVSDKATDAQSGARKMEYILENPPGDATGVVAATRLMPPPPLFELEQHLSQALANGWKAFRVTSDGQAMQAVSRDGIVLAQFERRQYDHDEVACKSYL